MKCPVCGHKVRPSKKYPGKYLCDTCRKRLPASAVIPDDTDTRNTRSASHNQHSASRRKRSSSRQQAFFDDPLKGPEIYHSTAAAMRSMKKNIPEEESTEEKKNLSEEETTEGITSSGKEYYANKSADLDPFPIAEPAAGSGQKDTPDPAPVSKEDAKSIAPDASSADAASPEQTSVPKKKKKKRKGRLPLFILVLILIVIAVVVFLFSRTHTSSGTGTGSTSDTSVPKKTGDVTKDIYKQGETASYSGVEITLDSYVESEGDDWSVPTEGNEFMFVHLTIVNKTSDDLVISSMASFENYCDDTKLDYSAAAFTALATTSDQPKLDGTIAPGETLEGYLSLEVPLNWSAVEIRYTDKIWSDDVVHFQIDRQE